MPRFLRILSRPCPRFGLPSLIAAAVCLAIPWSAGCGAQSEQAAAQAQPENATPKQTKSGEKSSSKSSAAGKQDTSASGSGTRDKSAAKAAGEGAARGETATTSAPARRPEDPASSDWPRFRGPSGSGEGAAEAPLTWSDTEDGKSENIAWKIPLPGQGASSPVVFGDKVYLTCFTGYDPESGGSMDRLERHLLCLSRSNGEILWDKAVPTSGTEEAPTRGSSLAGNTPVADDDGVFAFFAKSGVKAYDHQGELRWEADVGSGVHGWASAASPILYQDLVIVNACVESQSLVALDRKTGEERWRVGGINESWNTPLIVKAEGGRDEIVVAIAGKILSFDPLTGDEYWTCATDIAWYMVPSVVAHDGIVYAIGGRSGIAALAVRAGGSGDVTKSRRLWTSERGSNVSSPVFHEGHLYFANDSRETAYCLVAETGELVYEKRLDRVGTIYASAALVGDRVYYLGQYGRTIVVAAKPKFEQLAVNDLQGAGMFNSSPAIAGGRIFLRSDGFLYCVGK